MGETLRTETAAGVRTIVFCRAAEYNTITPKLRDELAEAIDEAERDDAVKVILLRAEGPAFCAGYGLDWATLAQFQADQPQYDLEQLGVSSGRSVSSGSASPTGAASGRKRVWDSVQDLVFMSRYVETYLKLWYCKKPTIAAVQGWCIGGGTDMVLCADIIVAGESAKFGYPPARVWGTPTTAMWVYRMGIERAKRYLLTGDEIPARKAAELGLILEVVPDEELERTAFELASRMARLPLNQLIMLKLLCNQTVENMGFQSSRLFGTLFDGIARHTQEGIDFVRRAMEVGWRQAVRERDDPFGDYGSRPREEKET
jgi:enoyl-CoA hydratase